MMVTADLGFVVMSESSLVIVCAFFFFFFINSIVRVVDD